MCEASQQSMAMSMAISTTLAVRRTSTASHRCAKWLVLRVLMRVLFAIVHLLLERLGLLLVGE